MYLRNREPSVDELLNDPLIRLLMERDGSSDEAVRALMLEVKRRMREQTGGALAGDLAAPAAG